MAMKRLGWLALLLTAWAGPAAAGELRVGAAAVNINPPEGTPLAGYYSERGSRTVLDNLYTKAPVLEQDDTRAALVVCDLISLPRRTVREARDLIEKQTGIPGANVMISATHTHTGPGQHQWRGGLCDGKMTRTSQ
jgi:neutral ceramidase